MKLMRKTTMLLLAFVFSVVLLGNTKLTALADTTITPIKTNTDVVGTIPSEGSLYYKITTSSNARYFTYVLEHVNIEEDGKFEIELRDQNNESLKKDEGKRYSSCKWSCEPNTVYYFRVGNPLWGGSTGQKFKLRVNEVADSSWERENNNNQASANAIAFNTVVKGVNNSDDQDWYKFTVKQAGYFEATLKHSDIAQDGKYEMQVFDQNGNKIIGGEGKNISLNRKSFNVGTEIYIKVNCPIWGGSTNQPYELKVNFVANNAYESEGNNDQNSADPVAFGKKYYGMMGENNDSADWFTFSNPKNGIVTLNFGPDDVAKTGEWTVKVVNASGKDVQVYRGKETKSAPMYLKKGKYYLKVEGVAFGESSGKLYTFNLSRKDCAITGATKIKKFKYRKGIFGNIAQQVKLSKKAKGATDYEVKISKSKKMKKPLVTTTAKAGKTLSISGSIGKGKRYVQVRPYITDTFGEKWYGKKSNVFSFKSK